MASAWSQTRRLTGCRKIPSTWPWGSSLSTRNQGQLHCLSVTPFLTKVDHLFVKHLCCPSFLVFPEPVSYWVYRFKPLQKVDGMSDSVCGSSQHCNSTPEQSVAAQSQHHQQYIGMSRSQLASSSNLKRTVGELISIPSRTSLLSWLIFRYSSRLRCRFQSFLLADTSHTLPSFPSPDVSPQSLPERITVSDITKLRNLYRDHCEVRLISVLK